MRLKDEQIRRLAETVYRNLAGEGLITPRGEKGAVVTAIAATISNDFAREQTLERDAERLMDQSIAAMGRAGAEIDRRKMLRMIKEKLAKERKIVL
jgi:hypothetical protein